MASSVCFFFYHLGIYAGHCFVLPISSGEWIGPLERLHSEAVTVVAHATQQTGRDVTSFVVRLAAARSFPPCSNVVAGTVLAEVDLILPAGFETADHLLARMREVDLPQ